MVDLVLRERRTASDAETASAALTSVFGEGRLTIGRGPFRYVQDSLVDDGISVARIVSSGNDVRLSISRAPDLAVVQVQTGPVRLHRGDDDVVLGDRELGLMPLGERSDLAWTSTSFDVFSFPLSSLARLLGTEGRALRLSAPSVVPRTPRLAGYWRRLASDVTVHVLNESELYQRDLLRGGLLDALTAATIETFGLSDAGEDALEGDEGPMRRALGYMAAHLGDPVSVAQIANASGLSVRGLQLLFQRALESTPVAHLRRLRLERARDLLTSPTAETSVGGVALQVGYTNLGRFSAHYRDEFDEMPSQALHAARSAVRP